MIPNFNFEDLCGDIEKGNYKVDPPKRKYICVKCGLPTYNNQVIGPHCKICSFEICNTVFEEPIQHNIEQWLKEKKKPFKCWEK